MAGELFAISRAVETILVSASPLQTCTLGPSSVRLSEINRPGASHRLFYPIFIKRFDYLSAIHTT